MIHLALQVAAFLFHLVCGIFLLFFGSLFTVALIVLICTRIRNRAHK
jgi:hypothetical protein